MRARFSRVLRSTVFVAALAAALPAAAQATPEEASRLQTIGETYFGKPAAGEPAVVTVAPEGDHYRATLDLAVLVRRLLALAPAEKSKDLVLDWPAMSTALAPRADGLWRFWDYRIPKMAFEADGQRTELVTDGIEFDTTFDPATGASPAMIGRFARISATSSMRKAGEKMAVTSESTSADVTFEGSSATTATPGVLDVTARQITGSMLYALGIEGGMADGVPDMNFTLNGGRQVNTATIRGFRNSALLDLWAHLVAHHDREDFTTHQGTLKAKIAAALPIFESYVQKIDGKDFSFESPFAVAKAEKIGLDVDLAGLTREGRFGMAFAAAGFEAWSLFMPKWAPKLVPREIALAGRVSGYDLATPTSVFLDSADFSAAKPLTDEQEARMAVLFLPRGHVDVVLDGNRLVSSLYEVTLDGRLSAGPDGAKGAITVKARGLDEVAAHLAREKNDEQAKAAAGLVAVARGFAERKGDEFVWRFDLDGDRVAVNGKPLK